VRGHGRDSRKEPLTSTKGEGLAGQDAPAYVTGNAAGQAQRIVANYRPRTTLLLLSRLIGEHFAGTPYGEHFAASAPE
jgi:hypothetical protein